MDIRRRAPAAALLCGCAVPHLWAQGPPFQTDDPVPVDLHHYGFYISGSAGGTPVEMDATGPAFEFNWGAIPRVQLHGVLPWGVVAPSNPVYRPAGVGPTEFGLTDTETGAKIAFYKESKYIPQIGSFTMLEIRTGSYAGGLGVGKVSYKLPLWAQKKIGRWLVDGGGYAVVPQVDYRNFAYGGFLVKYTFNKRLELGSEVFSHGAQGLRRQIYGAQRWWMLAATTTSTIPTINSFSATGTAWRDRRRPTRTSACTGPGESSSRRRQRRVHSWTSWAIIARTESVRQRR